MNRLLACVFTLGLLGSSWTALADMPAVNDAWVREAPPTSTVNAAYMHIANTTGQDITLVGASSPQFEAIQIHLTTIVDGVAKMLPQTRLRIAANGHIMLQPKGLHLMLINAKQPVKAGDQVDITLHFEGGASLDIQAEVRAAVDEAEAEDADHSHHHH